MKARLAAMEAEAAKLREVYIHSHRLDCIPLCSSNTVGCWPCCAKTPVCITTSTMPVDRNLLGTRLASCSACCDGTPAILQMSSQAGMQCSLLRGGLPCLSVSCSTYWAAQMADPVVLRARTERPDGSGPAVHYTMQSILGAGA